MFYGDISRVYSIGMHCICNQWILGFMNVTFIGYFVAATVHSKGYDVMWTLLGCAAPKGHFLSPDSLAKGVFLAKIP